MGFDNTPFASPQKVWASTVSIVRRGALWDALAASLFRALAGFGLELLSGCGSPSSMPVACQRARPFGSTLEVLQG